MSFRHLAWTLMLAATANGSAGYAAVFRSMSNPMGVTSGQDIVRRIAADPKIGAIIAGDSAKQRQARISRVEAWIHCTTFPLPCKKPVIAAPKALPANVENSVSKHINDTFEAMYSEVLASPRGSAGAFPITQQKSKLLDAFAADKPNAIRLFLGPA